jgi:hypothetical protein
MAMPFDRSDEIEAIIVSQWKEWYVELERLGRDPRVKKFSELRQKVDEADTFMAEASEPPIRVGSNPFDPYDAYDAFEFARDLAGRVVSSIELSKLASGRFPEMSNESRHLLMHFLIDNGVAEVARKTAAGRPTWYQFGPPMNAGIFGQRKGFGVPGGGLSRLKREDLEEVVVRVATTPKRP